MGQISDRLGGRAPGELVRSADWNALVGEVDRLDAQLTDAIAALGGRLDDLAARLDELRADANDLRGIVADLAARHLDVHLSSTRPLFAIGQRAELRAQVQDVDGTLPDPLPFVDFIAVWGRLQAVGGSTAIRGAEGRSLSVQVDAQGVARAELVADTAEDLSPEMQTNFEATVNSQLPGSPVTLAQAVLSASTPAEAADLGAFRTVSAAYDRPTEPHVKAYADTYFLLNPVRVAVPTLPIITSRWRDHRAVVLAFVKPDADPTTPDTALGSASLQVTFRDWLGPWIILDYLDVFEAPDIVAVQDTLIDGITVDLAGSLQGITDQIAGLVENRGVLGRMRSYQLVDRALDGLDGITDPPPFVDALTTTLQQAVRVQQALEPAQAAVATEVGRQPGIQALVQTAVAATAPLGALQTSVAAVSEELDVLSRSTGQITAGLAEVRETVSNLDGKVTVAVDRDFTRLSNEVTDLAGQLVEVERLYPEPIKETLLDFHSKLLKVDQLEQAINELRR